MLHFCITEEQNYLYCLIICQSLRSAFMFPFVLFVLFKTFLGEETATHSSILFLLGKSSWIEEPGGLQLMGSKRAAEQLSLHFHIYITLISYPLSKISFIKVFQILFKLNQTFCIQNNKMFKISQVSFVIVLSPILNV